MPFNDIFRLRLYGRLHGSQMVNVMHFVQDDVSPALGAQDLATDFATNMKTTLQGRASNQLSFEYVEVESIVPYAGGPFQSAFPANTLGAQTEAAISATLAEVISIYTSRGGRRGKGRIYLPGAPALSIANAHNGLWQPAQTTRTQTLATALATRYMSVLAGPVGRWRLGVWSRAMGPAHPPWTSDQFVRATSLTVRTTIRTQRRRQLGVGR